MIVKKDLSQLKNRKGTLRPIEDWLIKKEETRSEKRISGDNVVSVSCRRLGDNPDFVHSKHYKRSQ